MMYNIPPLELQEATLDLLIEAALEGGFNADYAEVMADDRVAEIVEGEYSHQTMYNMLVMDGGNPALYSKAISLEIKPAEGVALSDLSDKDVQLMYLAASISFNEVIHDDYFSEAAKAVTNRFINSMNFDAPGNISVSLRIDSEQVDFEYDHLSYSEFDRSGQCAIVQRRVAVLNEKDAVTYLHDCEGVDMDLLAAVDASALTDLFQAFETVEYHAELRRYVVIDYPRQSSSQPTKPKATRLSSILEAKELSDQQEALLEALGWRLRQSNECYTDLSQIFPLHLGEPDGHRMAIHLSFSWEEGVLDVSLGWQQGSEFIEGFAFSPNSENSIDLLFSQYLENDEIASSYDCELAVNFKALLNDSEVLAQVFQSKLATVSAYLC